jgi:CRP-like cAMP-binding protein
MALISNSRRSSDVSAIDFCIVERLNRKDYEVLQEEFPGQCQLLTKEVVDKLRRDEEAIESRS